MCFVHGVFFVNLKRFLFFFVFFGGRYCRYDVTATATTVKRDATSCDFVFTIVTATVMQLRCDCNQK